MEKKCHVLGKKAYRVTKKYELSTITSPLFDLDLLNVNYSVNGFHLTGMALRRVGADMDMNIIETYVDPDLNLQGGVDTCGSPDGTVRVMFNSAKIAPFTMAAQALVVHEGAHASFRRANIASGGNLEEAAAYIAEALFFEVKGESIMEHWTAANQWLFDQPHIDDPVQSDAKARIYAAAEKVIETFHLDTDSAYLSTKDVAELLDAIAKDPGYGPPKAPVKPKPDRPPTLRERIRRRREQRRARWGMPAL